MLSSTPTIDYLNQIHCLDSSPTSKFQDWSALLQEPELLSQYIQPKTASVCHPHDMKERYNTSLISNFHLSPQPLRKRSLESENICSEPLALAASSHASCDSEVPRRKKSRTDHPSPKPLPERHARKQNFACDLCRKLKIKCVFNPGKEKCERCERCDAECLDGSLMRAAAAAARAQQGSKKRKKRSMDLEGASSDPEPMHFTTKRIQTRTTAGIFQDVVDEPKSEIQIGSTVQVKKSTQHHYKAKESVVTRVVCKVVAVYLDGSESDPIPINLVRLSEKQKTNLQTTEPISEHLHDSFPPVAGSTWDAMSTQLSFSQPKETSDDHVLQLPAITNQSSQSPVSLAQGSLSGGTIATLDYPLPSPPLSMLSPEHASQALNVNNDLPPNGHSGQSMTQKHLIDPKQTMGPPPLTINTALASDYFLNQPINSTIATPSSAFNPPMLCPSSQSTSPNQETTYGFGPMFSHELPNDSYNPPNHTNTSLTESHGRLFDGFSRASFDTASSPTPTSHSYRPSTPVGSQPPTLPSSTISNPVPDNSVAIFAKLQEILNNALNQNTSNNFPTEFSSPIDSSTSIDTAQSVLRQFLNENGALTQSTIPVVQNLGNQSGYNNEFNDSNQWF
ncbi:hypothetical protein DFH28DRAFT_1131651 [Melampsora americana]|nr:hypothetical protein DFH28DRAFT_1131651 [Melampsora americana]